MQKQHERADGFIDVGPGGAPRYGVVLDKERAR